VVSESARRRRLFFALWPDAPLRKALTALVPAQGPRRMRTTAPEDLHMTLVFLGAATDAQLDCLRVQTARLSGERFELEIDRLGGFGRSGIHWAGATNTPDALAQLVRELEAIAGACGFAVDPRPFRAHITLARKAHGLRGTALETPLRWSAGEFCLVETVSMEGGSRYRVLERWALSGPVPTVG
jgi:2'-5' RNA ligase